MSPPALPWLATELLAAGLLLSLAAVVLIIVPVHLAAEAAVNGSGPRGVTRP